MNARQQAEQQAEAASLQQALAHGSRLLAEDPSLAAEQAEEILRVLPGHPAAQLLRGAALRLSGRAAEAETVLQSLAAAQPQAAGVHLELALARHRLGRHAGAADALRAALALDPQLPQAWRMLSDLLRAGGDVAGAGRAMLEHIRHGVRDPDLLRAAQALADGRLPEAEAALRGRLQHAPTDVAAIRMLAELAVRIGRHEEALLLFERCLSLAPGFREARHHYALTLHRDQQPEAALAELDSLLADQPDQPGYLALQAAVLCRVGEYQRGIALYERLLAAREDNARVWLSYGHALKTAGRQADAVSAYRRSLDLQPEFGEAWWSLANLKTVRFDDADIGAMRLQLAQPADPPTLSDEHRLHLEFALGKALDERGEHAPAFAHYAEGNRLRLQTVPYSADDTSARVHRARSIYTRDFFAERAGSGDPSPDPIFIVGLPRAGSTLIEQILASHSQVEGTMELPEIISIARDLRREAERSGEGARGYHEAVARLDPDALAALGRKYLEGTRVQRKTAAPLFVDKMPNNFLHMGLIRLILPNARIIDARRHPLDCCFSNFRQHFARGQNFSYSLEDIGRYYRDYVGLMTHFDAALPGWVHRVIHERLVEDTEAEVQRLLAFCGLPFEEACLRFHQNARPVRTASSEQVRRPINRDGFDQWRPYEAWLGPLKDALGPVLAAYPEPPEPSD